MASGFFELGDPGHPRVVDSHRGTNQKNVLREEQERIFQLTREGNPL